MALLEAQEIHQKLTNRKIYPVHQTILQMYCQRIEHMQSEKRDVAN